MLLASIMMIDPWIHYRVASNMLIDRRICNQVTSNFMRDPQMYYLGASDMGIECRIYYHVASNMMIDPWNPPPSQAMNHIMEYS